MDSPFVLNVVIAVRLSVPIANPRPKTNKNMRFVNAPRGGIRKNTDSEAVYGITNMEALWILRVASK